MSCRRRTSPLTAVPSASFCRGPIEVIVNQPPPSATLETLILPIERSRIAMHFGAQKRPGLCETARCRLAGGIGAGIVRGMESDILDAR